MKVRDIRRYLKGSESDNNLSKNANQTIKDTNVPTKGQYVTGKAHRSRNQQRGEKRHQRRQKETTQNKDIQQFFVQTGTNN
eukprot:6104855-Ditylum_brightwellii.AAC.1